MSGAWSSGSAGVDRPVYPEGSTGAGGPVSLEGPAGSVCTVDAAKRADTLRVLGELVEAAEPVGWENDDVAEYAIPAENYDALVELFAALQEREII